MTFHFYPRVECYTFEDRDNQCHDVRKHRICTLCLCLFTKSLNPVPICRQIQTGRTSDESAIWSPRNETPEKAALQQSWPQVVWGGWRPMVDPEVGVLLVLSHSPSRPPRVQSALGEGLLKWFKLKFVSVTCSHSCHNRHFSSFPN